MFYAIVAISDCNSAEFMEMKSQRQNLPWKRAGRCGSCTPGDAGSAPANLGCEHGVTKVLLESSSLPLLGFLEVQWPGAEREHWGILWLHPEQRWCPAGAGALQQDGGGVGWWDVLQGWAQGGILVLVHLLLFCTKIWEQPTAHQPPPSGKILNNGRQRGWEDKMLQIAKEHQLLFTSRQVTAGRQVRRAQGARVAQ